MEHLCYGLNVQGPPQAHVLNTGPPTVGAILGSCLNLRTWDLTGGVGHWGAGLKVSLSSTLLPVSLISSHMLVLPLCLPHVMNYIPLQTVRQNNPLLFKLLFQAFYHAMRSN